MLNAVKYDRMEGTGKHGYGRKGKPVIRIDARTGERVRYASRNKAELANFCSHGAIYYRINVGRVFDGYRYEWEAED